jgi:hypothetical protein
MAEVRILRGKGVQNFEGHLPGMEFEASDPLDESLRAMTAELITDLQLGKPESADQRLATVARLSLDENKFGDRSAVCLACAELPLAFC